MPLRIVSREEWGGGEVRGHPVSGVPVKYVVITNETPSLRCHSQEQCVAAVRRLYEYYVTEKGFSDIPFNFLVGQNGEVYEGRGWKHHPSGFLPYFTRCHGSRLDIAYIGDYTLELNAVMDNACIDLIGIGIEEGHIERFFTHLDHRDKDKIKEAEEAYRINKQYESLQLRFLAEKLFYKNFND